MWTRCRVVLVRPEVAGNIGATARVMRNFGLTDLVLVEPKADPDSDQARQRATHGESVLAAARRVATLDDALIDCTATAATSARNEGLTRGIAAPPDVVLNRILPQLANGPIALVFGPEPHGLTNEEVTRCDHLISIPTDSETPVLNLSHAVAICLYEAHRFFRDRTFGNASPAAIAPDQDRERMFGHLHKALTDIHFLWDEKAGQLFHGIRQIISRAGPTENEVRLLHGLARQMEWIAHKSTVTPDE